MPETENTKTPVQSSTQTQQAQRPLDSRREKTPLDLRRDLGELQAKHDSLRNLVDGQRKRIDELTGEFEPLRKERDTAVKNLGPYVVHHEMYEVLLKENHGLVGSNAKLHQSNTALSERIKVLLQQLEQAKAHDTKVELRTLREENKDLRKSLEERALTEGEATSKMTMATAEVVSLKRQVEQLTEANKKLELDIRKSYDDQQKARADLARLEKQAGTR